LKAFFVTKRLAFGSAITKWRHAEQLQKLGTSHVVNLRRTNNKKIRQFEWLWLPFKDDKKPRPGWLYKSALKFYRRARCGTEMPRCSLCVAWESVEEHR
jgi:hypothetical protein